MINNFELPHYVIFSIPCKNQKYKHMMDVLMSKDTEH
jgi:hypothetical protein